MVRSFPAEGKSVSKRMCGRQGWVAMIGHAAAAKEGVSRRGRGGEAQRTLERFAVVQREKRNAKGAK
jgi:hypothetical protein